MSRTLRATAVMAFAVVRLATLTADNPNQQARISQLRQEATQTLAALRAQSEAKRRDRAASAVDADTERAGMDAARATMRAMRTDENRLLADRVQAD
jgi:CHASE3 domain sensor protein